VTTRSTTSRAAVPRSLFIALAISLGVVGGWAEIAPKAFYRNFPGAGGRHWLPPLGPYNEHMLRDFGGLNLALASAAAVAAIALTRSAAACATAAWEAYSLPHLGFHAAHTAPYSVGDNVLNLLVLALAVAVPAIASWLVWQLDG
jgi:hypothetical protein